MQSFGPSRPMRCEKGDVSMHPNNDETAGPVPPWQANTGAPRVPEAPGVSEGRPETKVAGGEQLAERTLRIARPVEELAAAIAARTSGDPGSVRAPWETCPAPAGDGRRRPNPNDAPWAGAIAAEAGERVRLSSAPQPNLVAPEAATEELTREVLFAPVRCAPGSGWRRWVWVLTFGLVNLGESPADVRRRELVARVCQPVRGTRKVAFVGLKGGVGKTTSTLGAGSTFAALRGDHVVAVDANPDKGTLGDRVASETSATVRNLLNDAARISRYADVRAYTSQAPSRLEVLASEKDPHKAEAYSETDYHHTVGVLEHFYNLILTDCGTGLSHSAMHGVLESADQLVLVSSPALDGAQSAAATLDWLEAQGYGQLVARTVVVICATRPGAKIINLDELVSHFRARAVAVIPFDEHLAEGAEVDLERLRPATREAFAQLAALIADDFPAEHTSSGSAAVGGRR